MVFVYIDLHFRFLDDGSFKRHVFIWREGISHVFWRSGKEREATYVKKMELSESIGVTLKDGVWCWTSDTMLVAEVVCGISSSCVFLRTLYPC
jgi:hypothetical protein